MELPVFAAPQLPSMLDESTCQKVKECCKKLKLVKSQNMLSQSKESGQKQMSRLVT